MLGDRAANMGKLIVIILSLMMVIPFTNFETSENVSAGEVLTDITGATRAHGLGYDGSGITIAESGTGLDTGDNATLFMEFAGRVDHWVDWTETDTSDGVAEDSYGMSTPFFSWMVGDGSSGQFDPVDGKLYGMGMAPGARIVNERVFGDGAAWFNGDIADVFTDASEKGVFALTNSWGGGTIYEYALNSNKVDTAARDAQPAVPGDQPLLNFMACGNNDLMESACAKNGITIAVGEGYKPHKSLDADNIEELWGTSASGFTADGRIKPDIAAPATWGAGVTSHVPGAVTGQEAINADYQYNSGSGGSAAIGCGASAVFAQYYNDINGAIPSPAMTRNAMINGATDMGTADIPNADEGWGRLNLTNMIQPGFDIYYDDQNILLETGTSQLYDTIFINSVAQPLKISLTWTDVAAPSNTNAGKALINDIDMTVISPSGLVYSSNLFVGGWSIASIPLTDTANNVECVYVQAPEIGQWRIYVNGTDIQQDSVSATPATDQDYALVVSGSFDIGGGPVASGYADPNPTNGATTTTVYTSFSDIQNVVDAEYFIDAVGADGTGTLITPTDGAYNSPNEDGYAAIDISAEGWLPGEIHTIYVHALDSDANWGNIYSITIYVGTQYYLHVENSIGSDLSLQKIEPDQPVVVWTTTGAVPAPGQYQIGTVAWMTDAYAQDTDIGGDWHFFIDGGITTDDISGTLYAKVYEYGTMTLLNPTPTQCSTDVAGRYPIMEFTWTDTIPAATISAGDRVFVEIWLDATAGGGGAGSSTYDYVGDTEATPPDYGYFMDTNSCSLGTGPDYNSAPEFTDAQYISASTSNDNWAVSVDPGNQDEIFIWNSMEVLDDPAYITQIDLTFEGQGDDDSDFQIWVERQAGGAYWETVGTSMFASANTDITLTRSITVNPGDYIASNRIRWGVYETTSRMVVSADLLEAVVHYDKPAPEFMLGYDNDSTPSRLIIPEASGIITPGPDPYNITISDPAGPWPAWRFISFPTSISVSAATILDDSLHAWGDAGITWDELKWYDPTDTTRHWKTFNKDFPGAPSMPDLDNTMGLWIHITGNTGDQYLTLGISGDDPLDAEFMLYAGWNLIGYPSLTPQLASDTLPAQVTKMAYYDIAQPYTITDTVALDTVMMAEGNAYWVYSASDVLWQVDAPAVVPDPYPVVGVVQLYDGWSGGFYNPMTSSGGATVDVTWFDRGLGAWNTIFTVTNAIGQYSVDITNYWDGDVVFVNATFDATYGNNGYNYTYVNVGMGMSMQNVVCGVPYQLMIINPMDGSFQTAGVPFPAEYVFLDIDGMIAQGYFEWGDGLMDWYSSDPLFVSPVPGLPFDGTNSMFPGMGGATLTLWNFGFQTIEIYEGFPPGNNYLTPWGEFYTDPAGTIPGWMSDWSMIMVMV